MISRCASFGADARAQNLPIGARNGAQKLMRAAAVGTAKANTDW